MFYDTPNNQKKVIEIISDSLDYGISDSLKKLLIKDEGLRHYLFENFLSTEEKLKIKRSGGDESVYLNRLLEKLKTYIQGNL